MKKNFIAMAALACGLLTFSACSSDDDNLGGGQTGTATGELRDVTLNVGFSVASGAQTRGRDLYSEEALQEVNDMKIYVFKSDNGTYKYAQTLTGADTEENQDNFGFEAGGETGTEKHAATLKTKLTDGSYRLLAVGLEEGNADVFEALSPTAETTLDEFKLQLKSEVNVADEAFAGITAESAVEVSADNANFTVNIELKRVVAGVLAYFTRIPYEISYNGTMTKVTHVKVQVVTKGTAVNLKDRSAVTTAIGEKYYDLIDLDLTTSSKDGDNNWYKTQTTADGLGTGVAVVDNSWISGKYTMPLLIGEQETTMQVILTDGTNTLKTYPVVDKTTSSKKFDLVANHLYQLGGKPEAGDTGDDPEDEEDDPNPDTPVDLTTSQTINIIVNAEWENKHDLILGE